MGGLWSILIEKETTLVINDEVSLVPSPTVKAKDRSQYPATKVGLAH